MPDNCVFSASNSWLSCLKNNPFTLTPRYVWVSDEKRCQFNFAVFVHKIGIFVYKTLSNAFGDFILSKILKTAMSEHLFKIVSTKR